MADWIKVAKNSDLAPGELKVVRADDADNALYNNPAPHTRANPHAWQFDVCTGESVFDPQFRVRTFPVKIENDDVLVLVQSETGDDGGQESEA